MELQSTTGEHRCPICLNNIASPPEVDYYTGTTIWYCPRCEAEEEEKEGEHHPEQQVGDTSKKDYTSPHYCQAEDRTGPFFLFLQNGGWSYVPERGWKQKKKEAYLSTEAVYNLFLTHQTAP